MKTEEEKSFLKTEKQSFASPHSFAFINLTVPHLTT